MCRTQLALLIGGISCACHADDKAPFEWTTVLTLESVTNLRGGIERGTRNLGNLDLTLTINTEAADWWSNGSWHMYVLGDYGKNPSELTGDIQTLSNIATINALKIYEFWYQHTFVDEKIKFLVGLHDYNSTFYTLDSASLFSLASFGIGPDTAQAGPSIFSTTSMAAYVNFTHEIFYAMAAIYDGIPGDPEHPHGTHIELNRDDGLFKAYEVGFSEEKNYKIGLGGWQQTAQVVSPVNSQTVQKNNGYYLLGEKYLNENVIAFFQYGDADEQVNQLDNYRGVGVRRNNYWRENDALGIGYARAHNGLQFMRFNTGIESAETVWELTYFCPFVKHVSGQSSLYFIKNPGMQPALHNALAVGFRLYVEM